MPTQKKVNQRFFSVWSPAMAYVLGFTVADGTLTYTRRGGTYLAFHITDRALLYQVRTLLGSVHKIAIRVRRPGVKLGYRLQIGSKELCRDLERLGLTPNKSKTVRLPKIPHTYAGEFVRGYFDGDGCVYFNVLHVKDRKNRRPILQTKFTSGSREFLNDLLWMFRQHGIQGGFIVTKKGGYELALSHKDSLAIYRLMYNNAPTCGVFLKRKKRKFDHALRALYGMRS